MSKQSFDQKQLQEIYRKKVLNQELSFKEFNEKKVKVQSKPSRVIVELTENCNFKCIMCSQAFDPKYKKFNPDYNMRLETFDKVSEALFPSAYFVDLRGFGESVILPYWPDILERLEKYPFVNWHLVTNLSVPRDETWEKMMELGFILGFSCDAATKDTFETIRVGARFDRIVQNLKLVSDSVKKYNRGFIYFIVTVQKRNINELEQIIQLAHDHSVHEVQFKVVRQFDGYEQHEEFIPEDQKDTLAKNINASLDTALKLGVRLTINDHELHHGVDPEKLKKGKYLKIPDPTLNFPAPPDLDPEFSKNHPWQPLNDQVFDTFRVSEHKRCFKPYSFTYVTPDGRIGTCNHMMSPDIFEMGNLNYQTFDEIWNGDDYQFFRESLVTNSPRDLRCQWCFKHRIED